MKKLLTILLLFTVSSSFALKMDGAEILEHKVIISGNDNKVRIIDGHVDPIEKPSENTKENDKYS